MDDLHLHIIALNIPYPANYGGVIDIFYKVKALYNNGVKIILHCFDYGRGEQPELEKYCEKVYYYKRNTSFINSLQSTPYIVQSRKNKQLLNNLLLDNYPILFEGVHTCYYLNNSLLQNRFKVVRSHNIETEYYAYLAKNEKCLWKKLYYKTESKKLSKFEPILKHADLVLTVTINDEKFFSKFCKNVHTIPVFHTNESIDIQEGKGNFILYHGDLSSNENVTAATYLIENIFSKVNFPVIIAGKKPPKSLIEIVEPFSNIKLISDPTIQEIDQLIKDAHINVLITFQPTGLKLKLLHALSSGRFCLVNNNMLSGTELHSLCIIGDSNDFFIKKINEITTKTFNINDIQTREIIFNQFYSNKNSAKKIVNLIFKKNIN